MVSDQKISTLGVDPMVTVANCFEFIVFPGLLTNGRGLTLYISLIWLGAVYINPLNYLSLYILVLIDLMFLTRICAD